MEPIVKTIELDTTWEGTPLETFLNYVDEREGTPWETLLNHVDENTYIFGNPDGSTLPCWRYTGVFCCSKAIKGTKVNTVYENKMMYIYVRDYKWLNSLLSNPGVVYDEYILYRRVLMTKYLKNISYKKIYVQIDDSYLYLIFLNKDSSQLFTIYTKRFCKNETEIRRIVKTHKGCCLIRCQPRKTSRATYEILEDDAFFEVLQQIIKANNIQRMQDMSAGDFWSLVSCFGDSINYITQNSGVKKILKCKIIVINKLLGYSSFDTSAFNLRQLHFNKIKNDYYFTNKLSLSQVLEFNFITEEERRYIEDIIKPYLDGVVSLTWKKEEVDMLFDTKTCAVRFGSIGEAIRLVKNKNEQQVKDKFKSLYITMQNKDLHCFVPWFKSGFIISDKESEQILNEKMEEYKKT